MPYRSLYIIAYDIASPKRLQRVHRYLTDNAIPLQNSTFLFTASRGRFEYCWAQLARLIDRREDDIRAYPLPADSLRLELGAKSRKAFTAYDHLHAQPNKKTAKPTIDAT